MTKSGFFHTSKYVYEAVVMCYNISMQKIIQFDSGLKLVYARRDSVRSVAIGVFVRAGVAYERPEESGISHFIEHTLFKGTTTRSAFDIVNETDSVGASINAFTAKTHTCYYTTSLDEHSEKCFDVLSNMYFDPLFDEAEIEKEKKVVYEEINEGEDTPDDVCLERLSAAFFKGHALEKPILGTKKVLKTLTATDLRDYMARRYTPQNTVISIVGNITERKCVHLVEKYFESRMKSVPQGLNLITTCDSHSLHVVKKKDISQAHIAFAFRGISYDDPRRFALNLLSSVFSSEMSSRLFQHVRERLGLCYSIFGYPSAYENNGYYLIYTATNPQSVEKATEAIRAEICTLLADGITDEELNKGKQQLKTALVLGQESTAAMMRAFGRFAVQTGQLYDIEYNLKMIEAVTLNDISETARAIFDFSTVCSSLVSPDTTPKLNKLIGAK